ncbi:cytochrome P450 [Rhizodiscina lignyota]|uniref:Cytochrome P450 n=1 Tax=Rhizodiscina lignyota TaxID=1504668 RepID=A0A9P4I0I1_9PEZI|nr:cytochrome P450 [Rhizodiscina lignyota]
MAGIPETWLHSKVVFQELTGSVTTLLFKKHSVPLPGTKLITELALIGFTTQDGKFLQLIQSIERRSGKQIKLCILFGEDLDHITTRRMLQRYTENSHHMMNTFSWPIPQWISLRVVPGARRCVKARDDLYRFLVDWDKKGGAQNSSNEMRAILGVFEQAGTPAEVRSTFTNMMMVAFLANTPEVLGWFFMNLVQAPELFQVVRAECDALGDDSIIETDFKKRTRYLYSALFETCRCYVFTGTAAIITKECTLPGMGDHVFKPGDSIRSLGSASAMDTEVYGSDAAYWKGHRFVGEGESLLKYDLTFGVGRAPCPGRAFAIAELCMIAVNMIRNFDFSDWSISKHLPYEADDFEVLGPASPEYSEIIDLDGSIKKIIHPGNMSDYGPPGMTSSNIPLNDFACRLSPRTA